MQKLAAAEINARVARVIASWLLALTVTAASAQAPSRVALLIGNAAYADAPLRNPLNDVREVAASLKSLGFAVTTHENLKFGDMREVLRNFVMTTRSAEVRLIYFAGHGLQMRGRNYLLAVDARINNEADVKERTADATELIEQLSAIENGANVVIIDACRVHPMFTSASRKMWAAKPGLSKLTASGTVVAFSTRPGEVAYDGDGPISVYTRHLTQGLRQAPQLSIEMFFKRVRAGVIAETKNKQWPWESSDLNGELCFRPDAKGQCVREP